MVLAYKTQSRTMAIPGAFAAASTRYRGGLSFSSHIPSIDIYGLENDLRLFCIAFRPENKIHLFPPSKPTAQLLRDTVKEHWGVEAEHASPNCYTLCLEGTPFLVFARRENALQIKYICCLMLEKFKAHGWELVVCTDLSSKTDLTTWYFARVPSADGNSFQPRITASSLVCVSLSAKRKLQLINASATMQKNLLQLVKANYEPGFDQDAHYGRDYQIKLKGTPWDTESRDEIVAACKLLTSIFQEFGANGYHLYGLVNLKDTADSFFFEFDPSQTVDHDQYMIMALDEHSILRLIHATAEVVQVVKYAIDRAWTLGLDAEGRIGTRRCSSAKASPRKSLEDTLSWEFILKGSPWRAPASKIGRSRQFITCLLDVLLAHGWTVVTGLDITRSHNKKSALLFQRCPPVQGLRHACLSPLGTEQYQLINAPASLRQLVRQEFGDMVLHEKLSDNDSVYELLFSDRQSWVADPEHEKDSYLYARKRMGRLLQTLMDSNWRVIASADVAQEILETDCVDVGEGIHSWFVIYCGTEGNNSNGNSMRVTANSVLQVGGRIGSARTESFVRRGHAKVTKCKSTSASARSASLSARAVDAARQRRALSPPPNYSLTVGKLEARRSKSGMHPDEWNV